RHTLAMDALIKRKRIECPFIVPGRFEYFQTSCRLLRKLDVKRGHRPYQRLRIKIPLRIERRIVLERAVVGEIVRLVIDLRERSGLYDEDDPRQPYNRRPRALMSKQPFTDRAQSGRETQQENRQQE